jgi:glycosyltransferase involved in cell wall biosynthesis
MKIAVVTPYFNTENELLLSCHESVIAQTHPCTHILVADGRPQEIVDSFKAHHVTLPINSADYGDTPRGIGSVLAVSQGFDAIAYLDADNWYYPDHIATMVEQHRKTGAAVVTAARNLHRLDGSLMGLCTEVDGRNFVDTNCILLTRAAFSVLQVWWSMWPHLHIMGDRVLWANVIHKKLSLAHSSRPTVAYRTGFIEHYQKFGETPPAGAKSARDIIEATQRAMREWKEHVAKTDNRPASPPE